jgi:hypothetical protein
MVPNATRRRQGGLTIMGFLFVAAVVVIAVMVTFRVIPAYVEYFSVKKALQEELSAMSDAQNVGAFRSGLGRRFNTGYVESVSPADVQVTKSGNAIVATAEWERRLHMVGNAYILLEFEASASR